MSKLALLRKDVADKYEATVEKDVMIHAKGYSGKLSNVNVVGAEHLVKSKAGLLVEKKKADKQAPPVVMPPEK